MRHAGAIAIPLLAASVVLLALIGGLVPAAALAITRLVAQLLAVPLWAVAVPPVVPDADLERPAALEADDLDELNRGPTRDPSPTRHTAGEADLDNDGREWEALSVTR